MYFKTLILIFSILFFQGCSTKYPNLETVKKVDIDSYLGTWYEIARFEHFFEKDCKNVTATYTLKNDKTIKVINQCTNIKTNKIKKAIGTAYTTNEGNSKLKVSFFWPFYGDYWIIDLDKNYQYALIGTPSREYMWILARSKKTSEDKKEQIINKLIDKGFDINKIVWTIQE